MEDKNKVEAVLFAIGDKIELEEISRITGLDLDKVKKSLDELNTKYKNEDSTFMVINEGSKWKFTVKEKFMPLVQKIIPHTELSKAIMGTLAVIAWKSPVLQSDIVDIRGNKSYDHIRELLDMGFIAKQKHGRSYMIRLSQRFMEYFDLKNKEDVTEKFKNFKEVSEEDIILGDLTGMMPYDEKLGDLEVFESEEPDVEKDKTKPIRLEVFEEKESANLEIYDEPEIQSDLSQADLPQEEESKQEPQEEESPDPKVTEKLEEIENLGKKISKEMENFK